MLREPNRTATLVGIAAGVIVVAGAALLAAGCGGGGGSGGVVDNGPDPTGTWHVAYQDTLDTCDGRLDTFEETWKIRRSGGTLCISVWDAIKGCTSEFCEGQYANGGWTYQDTITNATDPQCTEKAAVGFLLQFTENSFSGTLSRTVHYTGTCPVSDCGRRQSVTGARCATDCWSSTGCP